MTSSSRRIVTLLTRWMSFNSRDGKALERFLQDYFDGKLKRYLKSEPIPENNDGPVKVRSIFFSDTCKICTKHFLCVSWTCFMLLNVH